jgi:hypothetical protein
MRPSRYPRLGHRLAPSLLRGVLDVPIPKRLLADETSKTWKFSDLNEESWNRFSRATCRQLGHAIVEHIRESLPNLSEEVREQHLPSLPKGTRIGDLDLDTRTRNCLRLPQRQGRIAGAEDLETFSIDDLLAIRGFGAKCLVDLLTSVETRILHPIDSRQVERTTNPQAFSEASVPQVYPDISREDFELLLRNLRLPKFPLKLTLDELSLSDVTQRWLRDQGFDKNLPELRGMTIGELFAVPDFKLPHLVEVVRALGRHYSYTVGNYNDAKEADSPAAEPARPAAPTTLEEELAFLASCRPKRQFSANLNRNQRIAMRYFGFDGMGGATLREIGETFGLTRERVRQICDRISKVYKHYKLPTPLLTRCISFIASQAPREADEVEEKLLSEGLTIGKFRVEGIIRAGELFGLEVPFTLDEDKNRRVIVARDTPYVVKAINRCARHSIRRFGVATLLDVTAQVEKRLGTPIGVEAVSRILQRGPDFACLDEPGEWFWLSSLTKNRVASRVKKILAVAGQVRVGELRAGIARHHQMKGYAPPKRVLLAFCRQLPGYRVDRDMIVADPQLDWQITLRGVELTMTRLLKQHGPIMRRAEFEALCIGAGIKRATFYVYLDYSPIIERYGTGVYGLRGAEVAPGEIEARLPARRSGRVLLDHGWTSDGRIWIGYRLSEAMIASGVFSIPGGLKRFLEGAFVLHTADGLAIGTLALRGSAAWGLSPLFRRRGGEAGDTLVLCFDLSKRHATAQIGDEGLLDDFQEVAQPSPETVAE